MAKRRKVTKRRTGPHNSTRNNNTSNTNVGRKVYSDWHAIAAIFHSDLKMQLKSVTVECELSSKMCQQ